MANPLYTLEGDRIKSLYRGLIENLPKADRAIDIIYQTPDEVILPFLQEALKRNLPPDKLLSAVASAEKNIFRSFQVAPGDEIHHGRASLVSLRSIRDADPDSRVTALNRLSDRLGGPIGNSSYNLRGNAADRRAHTGGENIVKMADGRRISEVFDITAGDRSRSMHPGGTNATKDSRNILVNWNGDVDRWVDDAVASSGIQFADTVEGRKSDMARRALMEMQLAKELPSPDAELLYGPNVQRQTAIATKKYLADPVNEALKVNPIRGFAYPGTPKYEALMRNPLFRANIERYEDVLYQAGLGPEAYKQLTNGLKVNRLGATLGATVDRNVGVKLGKGDVAGALTQGGTNAAIGAVLQGGLKIAARRAPAALARLAGGAAGTGGVAGPMLAAAGAIDIADGFVEGATGKGFIQRGIEASPPVVRAAQQIPKVHNTVQSTLNPVNPTAAVRSLAIQAVKPPAAQRAKAAAGDPKAQMFINRRDALTKVLTNPGNELKYFGGQLLNKLGIRK